MINHVRTLLLNQDGDKRPDPSFFGEELVPAEYRITNLPSGLQRARTALFGNDPDVAGLNYMLWQYMRILHSTEFVDYVYDLDSRVTYMHDQTLVNYAYGPSANNTAALQFSGTPNLGGADGRLQENWQITQLTPTLYTLRNGRTGYETQELVTVIDNLTSYMPIPGQASYLVRICLPLATTTAWYITYTATPTFMFDPINRADQANKLGAAALVELFPNRAPFSTFKQLWEKESRFAYKMSGLLLALAYRTEELRLG